MEYSQMFDFGYPWKTVLQDYSRKEPLLSHHSLCTFAEGRRRGSDKGSAATIPHPDQEQCFWRDTQSSEGRQGHQPQTPDGPARPPSSHPTVGNDAALFWFGLVSSNSV